MKEEIIFKGTTLSFKAKINGKLAELECILTESNEPEFVFQIISNSGQKKGSISGYIKNDTNHYKTKGVTKKHLIKELRRNFLDFKVRSLRIHTD